MTENIFSPKDIDSLLADVFDTNVFKEDSDNKRIGKDSLVRVKRDVIGRFYTDLPNIYVIVVEYGHNFKYIVHHRDIQIIDSLDDGEKFRFVDDQNKTVDVVKEGDYILFDSPHHSTIIRVLAEKFKIKEPYLSDEEIEEIHNEIRKRTIPILR